MRDPFGVHTRRVRRGVSKHLLPGDEINSWDREYLQRDYWVLTAREIILLHSSGVVRHRVHLLDISGSVTQSAGGITIRVTPRRESRTLIGTFRAHSDLTRALSELLSLRPQ